MNKNPLMSSVKVGKLLLHYSIPSIISMLVVALYNVIDRIFIGNGVGPIAISGLAITFPLMSLVTAIGTLVGVGGSARMSIALGAKNYKWAELILGNVLLLTFILSVVFITPVYIYLEEIVILFGASEQTLPYAMEYLRVIIPGTIFTNLAFSFSGLIRSSGYPTKSMIVILVGVVLNIILDPLFIFYFDMGIKGAAIATVISMFVSSVLALRHFVKGDTIVCFRRSAISLKRKIIINITSIGLAPFLMNVASCMVGIILNNQLVRHGGDLAVGAWGIINSYAMVIVTIIIGIGMGMQPIVGYNFGADNKKRVKDVLKVAVKAATVVLIFGFALVELFASELVSLFTSDPELSAIATKGMRLVFVMFPIIGFQIVVSTFFQSMGYVKESIFMTLSRQIIFLIPIMYIFSSLWGLTGIWLAIPVSDTLATFVAWYFLNKIRRKIYR